MYKLKSALAGEQGWAPQPAGELLYLVFLFKTAFSRDPYCSLQVITVSLYFQEHFADSGLFTMSVFQSTWPTSVTLHCSATDKVTEAVLLECVVR